MKLRYPYGLKRKGNFTIAQDESTCVVYGMPRAAVEFKAVDSRSPLNLIADSLLSQKKKAEPICLADS